MTGIEVLHKFLAFGVLGLLIEVFFTGIASLLQRNWRATSQTYLWMILIYGVAGFALDGIHDILDLHWLAMAPIYMMAIYGIEFISGLVIEKIIGRCPWHYGLSHWTPMGLINFKYAPFWLVLGCAFNPISAWLQKAVHLLAGV